MNEALVLLQGEDVLSCFYGVKASARFEDVFDDRVKLVIVMSIKVLFRSHDLL